MDKTTLAASFDTLRQEAQSVAAIRHWLSTHPETVLGKFQLSEDDGFSVEAEIDENEIIANAWVSASVSVNVTVDFWSPMLDILPIDTDLTTEHGEPLANFKNQMFLNLRLEDWPFACALLADRFIRGGGHSSKATPYLRAAQHLNACIPKHFPGWTLEKLLNLKDAELLPEGPDGRLLLDSVSQLLFKSRSATLKPLPNADFAP